MDQYDQIQCDPNPNAVTVRLKYRSVRSGDALPSMQAHVGAAVHMKAELAEHLDTLVEITECNTTFWRHTKVTCRDSMCSTCVAAAELEHESCCVTTVTLPNPFAGSAVVVSCHSLAPAASVVHQDVDQIAVNGAELRMVRWVQVFAVTSKTF